MLTVTPRSHFLIIIHLYLVVKVLNIRLFYPCRCTPANSFKGVSIIVPVTGFVARLHPHWIEGAYRGKSEGNRTLIHSAPIVLFGSIANHRPLQPHGYRLQGGSGRTRTHILVRDLFYRQAEVPFFRHFHDLLIIPYFYSVVKVLIRDG